MPDSVDLYNTSYDNFSAAAQQKVRAETYGEDIGQSGWMTASELRYFIDLLEISPTFNVLEVGSGSGGPAIFLAETAGCRITGIDINEFGVNNANALAKQRNLERRVRFQRADVSEPLPFDGNQFDAIISNDAMCHIPRRLEVLKECFRVLKPGGKMLFTDALVVTGLLSHEEIARRSSIGYYFFVPPGENERLMREAGFHNILAEDRTADTALVSRRWHDARSRYQADMVRIEGETNFNGLQEFLWCVHIVSSEKRLSRYMYVAHKGG